MRFSSAHIRYYAEVVYAVGRAMCAIGMGIFSLTFGWLAWRLAAHMGW